MKVLCLGHTTFDTTLAVSGYPEENSKYRIDKKIECGGGPAANASYLLAKWGMNVSFAGMVGSDYYGEIVKKELDEIGVDTKYLEKCEGSTSSGYIIANLKNGSRTIITAATPKYEKLNSSIDEQYDFILVDGEHVETALDVLKKNKNAISILDAGTLKPSTLKLASKVTFLACSKVFAEDFTKEKFKSDKSNWINIYKKLEEHFKTNVIITLESDGALIKNNDEYLIVSSIDVKASDSTGAGDIFHGALMYFIMNNYSLLEAVSLANITGALSVTKIGSRNSMPPLAAVLEIGRSHGVIK